MKYNQYKNIKLLKVLMFGKYRILIFKEYDKEMLYTYYIQNIEYGIIQFVYGQLCKDINFKDFIDIIKRNINEDVLNYMDMYED